MFIKKHPSRNKYIRAGDLWVRDFTQTNVEALAIDHLFDEIDKHTVVSNETVNSRYARIHDEKITFRKILIVSDGYKFNETHKQLTKIPNDVAIMAVNGALKKWTIAKQRPVNAYVVNNPYPTCLSYIPTNGYYPACIASSRTNHAFVEKYQGQLYIYEPAMENVFGRTKPVTYRIDDYRNPICAAIGLAYRFGVRKLMLCCCDDAFENQRDVAVKMKNGLWTFPQHLRSHDIVDANLYWLTHQKDLEVLAADWSNGPELKNAAYISCAEDAIDFFKDEVKTGE